MKMNTKCYLTVFIKYTCCIILYLHFVIIILITYIGRNCKIHNANDENRPEVSKYNNCFD